jgi:hypothetical protein
MNVAAPEILPPGGRAGGEEPPVAPGAVGHPKGTLAIVAFYGLLFVLGWLTIYVCLFVPRGTPHP